MSDSLQRSINAQRLVLSEFLSETLSGITDDIPPKMQDPEALDKRLAEIFRKIGQCKYVYVLNADGVQVSSNMTRYGADGEALGRDRSTRPYMKHMHDEKTDCHLSQAYISRNKKRPSVTAVKTIRDNNQQKVGFLGVDFDLRELPHTQVMYEEPSQWRQIKGDPAIRQQLFYQERVESLMDKIFDDVLAVHEALITEQGIHHIHLHFSASTSTIWHIDDPYVYRILTMDELQDRNIFLAYPHRDYFERATIPPANIGKILQLIKELRFADETIYLRAASLNTVSGIVGLNFSCDGTHYLNHDDFLQKGLDFWFGTENDSSTEAQTQNNEELQLDLSKLDDMIEKIAGEGCMKVNKLLHSMESGDVPESLNDYNSSERDYIFRELKSVMNIYEGAVCSL